MELADRLKLEHPRLETIFMSGYPDEMLSERGVLEDKHRYMHKPFTSGDLLSETERALDVALSV